MSFTDRFTYYLLKLAHGWLNRLLQRERSRVGATIGSVAFNKIAIRKTHARRHLKMAFPDKSDNYIDYHLRENEEAEKPQQCPSFTSTQKHPAVSIHCKTRLREP